MTAFKQKITAFKLIPAGGGCFEVAINGELVYSKLETGEFPDEREIQLAVASRLAKK